MTNAQRNAALSEKMRENTLWNTRTKADALNALVRKGFLLPNGDPAPAFAPEPEQKASA
ncbi:MAG: hypothetical protein QM676_15440 [Novosphingobium sp.]